MIRSVHFDGCSLTRWSEEHVWQETAALIRERDIEVLLSLDVLFEMMRRRDSAHRERHMRVLRCVEGQVTAVPMFGHVLGALRAGLLPIKEMVLAERVVRDALRTNQVDEAAWLYEKRNSLVHGQQWRETGRAAHVEYAGRGIADHASYEDAIRAVVHDRAGWRRWHHDTVDLTQDLDDPFSIGDGGWKSWRRVAALRCWVLGYVWIAREGSLEADDKRRSRLPSDDDLNQLLMLPRCDVFVTDDRRLRRAAEQVLSIERRAPVPAATAVAMHFEQFSEAIRRLGST